ncbi:TPA: arylamine N-acetyltransferase family protein [Bacillus thuringiensis]|uniref:Arylamine N-acetyltransferase n=4 Tax=Bacillus cereus group TaxID=86661 RepID=A0A9X6KTD0_BACTU|nr:MULTISPECIES: arylamine N-acetyltransferase [Bacillus cereus group]AGE78863.1 N-hydroxyarylamine O-acetyltransferase [Bacillus thuringiensis serovar kurstaki str. HD73]AHZ51886.1 N-hydroxyarylamine O-acetyltransferase [Bacillus thuringiensis serovar kurstaki str. YBT-1520]AIE34300.1 N-hydroxyarylamine O-acetyltransferase [Bacillus thuringiensis serovar kurstaki str. HD-1]AIM31361.1 N-hydroxyarylamine O-acetyltransferase [Bacillus thuringiensis serovar kurstaki str. YBT-1520]AJA20049.1 acety
MTSLQNQLFTRLNLKKRNEVTFEELPTILFSFAHTIPFENLDVIARNTNQISLENLREKILTSSRGGLCYELNTLFYYFLKNCGYDVQLALGTVYKNDINAWALEDGHITIILTYDNLQYLIDVGIASLVPLVPVPFTGESVSSKNGSYRVRRKDTSKGNYVLERIDTDGEWKVCHAFYKPNIDEIVINDVQRRVIEDEKSIFNKGPIAVKLTNSGHISLTNTSLTEVIHGEKTKREITENQYKEFLYTLFAIKL